MVIMMFAVEIKHKTIAKLLLDRRAMINSKAFEKARHDQDQIFFEMLDQEEFGNAERDKIFRLTPEKSPMDMHRKNHLGELLLKATENGNVASTYPQLQKEKFRLYLETINDMKDRRPRETVQCVLKKAEEKAFFISYYQHVIQ